MRYRDRLNPSQLDLCELCGKRPKYVEKSGFVHPYCGKTCAQVHHPCKYPACDVLGKSAFSGFCGPGHAKDAVQQGRAYPCVECRRQPQAIGHLCLGCNHSAIGKLTDPQLRGLTLQDPKAASLIDTFHYLWKGFEPVKIGKIYEIRLPRNVTKAREAYNSKLTKLDIPRQIQTFHSTQCICDLGTNKAHFCTWSSCGICAIIQSSFTTFEFGIKSNTGQFGSGVYSYLEPSLADRHAVTTTSSPYRVMLACEVSLPPSRVQPPKSSGIVQSREDGPSVFVSGAEAITPKYLILYSKPLTTTPTRSNGGG